MEPLYMNNQDILLKQDAMIGLSYSATQKVYKSTPDMRITALIRALQAD